MSAKQVADDTDDEMVFELMTGVRYYGSNEQ
jgi:hypothetical protein